MNKRTAIVILMLATLAAALTCNAVPSLHRSGSDVTTIAVIVWIIGGTSILL